MPSRRRSRQQALQILYQVDMQSQPVEEAIAAYYDSMDAGEEQPPLAHDGFADGLVQGTLARAAEIDERIVRHSEHWRLGRMAAVDRNLLRLAIYEMLEGATPPAVVIDEALELARRFSGDDAVAFLNGVLDAVNKELHAACGSSPP